MVLSVLFTGCPLMLEEKGASRWDGMGWDGMGWGGMYVEREPYQDSMIKS